MFQHRLSLMYGLFCAALLLISLRMVHLQVLGMTDEDPDAILRSPVPLTLIETYRGAILDRRGELLVADRATLGLAVHYKEMLLLQRAAGDPLRAFETRFMRRYVRARARALRQDPSADPAERLLVTDALAGPVDADGEALLRGYLDGRLDDLARVSGRSVEEILQQIDRQVSTVRRIHSSRTSISQLYEETVAHIVAEDVPVETAALVEGRPERFPGVVIETDTCRYYPTGPVAPHVIGYLGHAARPARGEVSEDPTIRPGERIGLAGVEKQFDRLLRGTPGIFQLESDPRTGAFERHMLFPAQPGRTLRLSLDLAAQRAAETALGGRIGAAVVMDLRTGELLVLASSPLYDNTDFNASFRRAATDPARPFLSRATQDSVASGSVMKPVVALAAAAAGHAGPETTCDCTGQIIVGRTTFRCNGVHGRVDLREAISKSCNVYFYEMGRRAGPQAMLDQARAMGFGGRTGVDLPFEWAGRLPDPARPQGWYLGNTLNLSIGQENVQVTPLQVAVVMGAVATGGKVLRPTILHRVDPPADPELLPDPGPVVLRHLTLPAEALRGVREGMRDAPYTGTGRSIPEFRDLHVAVKSGTAETGGTDNHAWVAGWLPVESPRYAFAVVLHRVPGHGAEEAGPPAAAMLTALMAGER